MSDDKPRNDKECENCTDQHECKSIYKKVGHSQGPSVLLPVLAAFVLPLVVFFLSVWIFETVLVDYIDSRNVRSAAAIGLSAIVTVAVILIVRNLRTAAKNKHRKASKNE